MKKTLLLIGIFILAVSCSKGGGAGVGVTGESVAKVGNVTLTKEEVLVAMEVLPIISKQTFQGPDGTARFVDEMARRESLYLEAKKRGLDQNKEVQMRLEEARKNALVGYLLKKVGEDNSEITEKAMKDYYLSRRDDFTTRDQVKVSQIVVKSPEDARKALDRLKTGVDFTKLAADVSVDKATAKSGGDIGFIDKNTKLAPQLVQEILRLRKGEVSSPVTMPDGIHILKVTEIKGKVAGFGEVKGEVAQVMKAERRKKAIDKLLESVKKDYKIEVNKAAVAKLPPIVPPGQGNIQLPPGHPSMQAPK